MGIKWSRKLLFWNLVDYFFLELINIIMFKQGRKRSFINDVYVLEAVFIYKAANRVEIWTSFNNIKGQCLIVF